MRYIIKEVDYRTIAPEENCPQPKTNSKPNPNINRGHFSLGAIVWFPPNPKTNSDLDPNRNGNQGAIFLWEQLSRYQTDRKP